MQLLRLSFFLFLLSLSAAVQAQPGNVYSRGQVEARLASITASVGATQARVASLSAIVGTLATATQLADLNASSAASSAAQTTLLAQLDSKIGSLSATVQATASDLTALSATVGTKAGVGEVASLSAAVTQLTSATASLDGRIMTNATATSANAAAVTSLSARVGSFTATQATTDAAQNTILASLSATKANLSGGNSFTGNQSVAGTVSASVVTVGDAANNSTINLGNQGARIITSTAGGSNIYYDGTNHFFRGLTGTGQVRALGTGNPALEVIGNPAQPIAAFRNSSSTQVASIESNGSVTLSGNQGVGENIALSIARGGNNYPMWVLRYNTVGEQLIVGALNGNYHSRTLITSGNAGSIEFSTLGTPTVQMIINGSGRVGIGTTSPSERLDLNDGRVRTAGIVTTGNAPSISANVGLGTGGTVSLVSANDMAGTIRLTPGSNPSTTAVATITFSTALPSAPRAIQLTGRTINGCTWERGLYVSNATTTSFQLLAETALPANAAAGEIYYTVFL